MVVADKLKIAFNYYLDHQDELVAQYAGKYVVIHDNDVFGAYDDDLTAVTESERTLDAGTFLVQKVSVGDTDYTQTFASRASFP
jgi:hypothetical protein